MILLYVFRIIFISLFLTKVAVNKPQISPSQLFYDVPYSNEQKHVLISDTPMLLIEINSISNMGCQK